MRISQNVGNLNIKWIPILASSVRINLVIDSGHSFVDRTHAHILWSIVSISRRFWRPSVRHFNNQPRFLKRALYKLFEPVVSSNILFENAALRNSAQLVKRCMCMVSLLSTHSCPSQFVTKTPCITHYSYTCILHQSIILPLICI